MIVSDRLIMELGNNQYLTDEQMEQFLNENGLTDIEQYDKATMQKQLLNTVVDILETVTNDIDIMTGISTDFADIGQAYEFLEQRIINVKNKIAAIPDEEEEESAFSLMYTRGGTKTMGGIIGTISDDAINGLN